MDLSWIFKICENFKIE